MAAPRGAIERRRKAGDGLDELVGEHSDKMGSRLPTNSGIHGSDHRRVSKVCPRGSPMLHQKNRRSAKLRLKTVKKWGVLSITIDVSSVVVTLLVEYQSAEVYDGLIYAAVRNSSSRTVMAST